MKNYSLSKEEAMTFILNYNIEGDKIVINLASGNSYEVENTSKNEKIILEKMRNQVVQAGINGYFRGNKAGVVWGSILAAAGALNIAVHANSLAIENFGSPLAYGAFIAVCSCEFGIGLYDAISSQRIINDYKKNKLFLDNEDLFIEEIKDDDDYNIRKEYALTLNDVDKMSYREVMSAIEKVKLDECLDKTAKRLERRK